MDRNRKKAAAEAKKRIVALRKESVDRNFICVGLAALHTLSLSARRAWIEMRAACSAAIAFLRRSPQGERG